MTPLELDYQKIVELLNKADAPMSESVLIDAHGAIEEQVLTSDYGYDEALRSIAKISTPEQMQKEQKEAKGQSASQAPGGLAGPSAFAKELEAARGEFGKLIGLVGNEIGGVADMVLVMNAKNSVMASLSLQDQISELEKISLGIDERTFDKEHLKVIRQEVLALYRLSRHSTTPAEAAEFVAIRNKRLEEVKQKLEMMDKRPVEVAQQIQQPTPL